MATYAYDIQTPLDLLGKLGRELRAFRQDVERQSDHAYNFAITAWHLTDWLWQYDKTQNPDVEKCFGCASRRSFQAKICEQSPDIKICNELAIGSKHFHVEKHKKAVESAEVSLGPSFILNVSLLDVDRLGPGPVLKVRMVDGTSVKSAKVFNGAMKFWFGFFQDHGLLPEGAKMEDFI